MRRACAVHARFLASPRKRRHALAAALALAALPTAAPAYDWDALGREFCARSQTGTIAAVAPLLTEGLKLDIEFAFARSGQPIPPTLFQTYATSVPVCVARTRNAALIEVTRSGRGGAPAWTEYLVVVPEKDGTTRIDDVLFATRRSDTLRTRLRALAGGG